MLYAFTDPTSPAGGISVDGWKMLWKYCANGSYTGDSYGFDPLNRGDVQVSTFYSSSLYGKIDSAADSSSAPLTGTTTPENWGVVDIDDGTYYIAEYIGILDRADRTPEQTEAVKAFAEWFGSAERIRRRNPRHLSAEELRAGEGGRHRHDLCGICCGAQQGMDEHHDQPRLLLG